MAHKILFVDDDATIQGYAKTVLEGAGFLVEICGTVKDALKNFRLSRPDLMIVDIGLPDGSGLDLCQQLGVGADGSIPVIFLTARGDLHTRLKCFQSGAQDYIQKPIAVEELLARVKVHLKLKKSHDELLKRNYDLELRARARQDLADMIVHDLKTPLTSIKGTLELIAQHGLISNADYQKLLDYAGSAADFMLLMLNDLLDIGQAEQAGLKPEWEDVALEPLLTRLRALFTGQSDRLGIGLEINHGGVLEVRTDRNLLFRILVNVVSNAYNASRKGAKVELDVLRRDAAVHFRVADRGPGVADAEKTKIFEKYATTKSKSIEEGGSSGIGLTFCRLAAYALRGKIWVEDRPGGGSFFIIELPLGK